MSAQKSKAPSRRKPAVTRLSRKRRDVLQILAGSGHHGVAEAVMKANGFSTAMLAGMACDGFVAVEVDTVRAVRRTVEIRRFQITDAGRKAIDDFLIDGEETSASFGLREQHYARPAAGDGEWQLQPSQPCRQCAGAERSRSTASRMTVMLITAVHAAETLAAFHRQRAASSVGTTRDYHHDMARCCTEDADNSRQAILASGVTVEHQANAERRHDLETAQRIIDRHPIMHGVGMPGDDVPTARMAMARDIADVLAAARGGTAA